MKCNCRNISWALGIWSLHSKGNFISIFIELHVHGNERWPMEVTSNTHYVFLISYVGAIFSKPVWVPVICGLLSRLLQVGANYIRTFVLPVSGYLEWFSRNSIFLMYKRWVLSDELCTRSREFSLRVEYMRLERSAIDEMSNSPEGHSFSTSAMLKKFSYDEISLDVFMERGQIRSGQIPSERPLTLQSTRLNYLPKQPGVPIFLKHGDLMRLCLPFHLCRRFLEIRSARFVPWASPNCWQNVQPCCRLMRRSGASLAESLLYQYH